MIDFIYEIPLNKTITNVSEYFIKQPIIRQNYSNDNIEFIAWGDPIVPENFEQLITNEPTVNCIINKIYGHYYYIFLNKITGKLAIGNALFSILPVYYSFNNLSLCLSNNPFQIFGGKSSNKFNKRLLLENILYYYPLFNQSFINGVNLLLCNHNIEVFNGKVTLVKHTTIEDFFTSDPANWRNSANRLADLFIQAVEKYLPNKTYCNALTGGLDGRTLAACGLFYNKKFTAYTFGSSESDDVKIAKQLSLKLGISFDEIKLDETYVRQNSFFNGLAFISGANGTASFSRSHYMYATRVLSKESQYMITGNFGSEIFRAAHVAGVVISPNLYRLLNAANFDEAIKSIELSPEWEWLNKASFSQEWESLKEDLKTLPCFDPAHKSLTKNQQFYKIVFEEIFRKYFGAEMVNQFQYIANRTPFLDIDFVKAILATGLAGVHSDFFTHNPLKRFKGQVLYAHIIRKAYPLLGKQMLDKGYRPIDLLGNLGKIRIASSFVKKRIKRKIFKDGDPYSVNAAFKVNTQFWNSLDISTDLFNISRIKSASDKMQNRDSLFIALSQAWFYNENFKEK